MSRIFWDSNLFIYLFEGRDEAAKQVAALRTRIVERGDELLTSTLTLGEVLVKPIEQGDQVLRRKYEHTLETVARLVSFDAHAAKIYAALRQDRTLRAPDAIQLACAAAAGTDLFITNDDRLSRKTIPGIQFILPLASARI